MKEFNEDWQQAKCALLKSKVFFHIHTLIFTYYNRNQKIDVFVLQAVKQKFASVL